ncbi:hypothetical protein V3N95_11955 (plasmid) [Micrococcaceae bacterium Sec6.3]
MSAYMVGNEHINVMIWKAQERCEAHSMPFTFTRDDGTTLRVSNRADREALGRLLHEANLASVTARYGSWEAVEPYRYENPQYPSWSALEVLSAMRGYQYQACEVQDWTKTEAHRLCEALSAYYLRLALRESGVSTWTIERGDRPQELADPVAA